MGDSGFKFQVSALRHYLVPALLIACVVVVGFWEFMAQRSARPFRPFDLTGEELTGFAPRSSAWQFRSLPVAANDPVEPNIVVFEAARGASLVRVRLVHGYNMPMCMKIKQYQVDLVGEETAETGGLKPETGDFNPEPGTLNPEPGTLNPEPRPPNPEPGTGNPEPRPLNPEPSPFAQVWRLTSSVGDASIWITSILRSGDFRVTGADVRSLAFPRVDVPDDPRWVPRGLTWSSLRHPVAGLRAFLRERWNSSRTDPLTFLRLKQPAWASEELLTYVACSQAPAVTPANEARVRAEVAEVHALVLADLQRWKAAANAAAGGKR
jgi:hypothetical protein